MKCIFFGRVYPERKPITLFNVSGEVEGDDIPFKARMKTSIIDSQVMVDVDTDSKVSLIDLRNTVSSNVSIYVDTYGYIKGHAYSVEIISAYLPENAEHYVFGIGEPNIISTEKDRPLQYKEVLTLALKIPTLYMVFGDLREAINKPIDTYFHCRRATERIANYFMKSGNKAKGWKDTVEILGLNEDEIETIKKESGDQRHGIHKSVFGETRVDVMMKTWKIVDKFIVYLKTQEFK